MNFIIDLPVLNSCSVILTVMDQLTKMIHFIPSPLAAKDIAQLWLDHVVYLHGFPDYIMSDCGSQFISWLWYETLCLLEVCAHLL